MMDGQVQQFPTTPAGPLTLHDDQRDPLAQDVYDAARMACFGGLSGGDIIAAVQQAIADARDEDAPVPVPLAVAAA